MRIFGPKADAAKRGWKMINMKQLHELLIIS
jgi:hypothetical protein